MQMVPVVPAHKIIPFIIGHGGDGAPDNTDNGDEDVDVMIVLYSIVQWSLASPSLA